MGSSYKARLASIASNKALRQIPHRRQASKSDMHKNLILPMKKFVDSSSMLPKRVVGAKKSAMQLANMGTAAMRKLQQQKRQRPDIGE